MYKICFLIPFYNHPDKIQDLVRILKEYSLEILIVDDASSLNAKQSLKNLNVHILEHAQNGGKGAAVKTGMRWALQNGFTHCFQIDADMQHDLNKIPAFLELSKENPNCLISGYGKYDGSAPKARLYGRKITDFWVYVNTLGGKFKDVMTGFRIYPLNLKILEKTTAQRMDFDIEVLLNYYKFGVKILWLEVGVVYGGISHFKSLKDNLLISKMHAKAFFEIPFYLYWRIKNAR